MLRTALCLSTLFVCLASAAIAQTGASSAGIGVSTLGFTVEGRHQVTDRFAVRGLWAGGLNRSEDQDIDGISYSVDAELGGIALLGDYSILGGGWHVSAGVFLSTTEVTATADDSSLEVGGGTYNASVEATAEFASSVAPMVTLGYAGDFGSNWRFGAELGLISTGGVDVTLQETTSGGNVIPTGDLNSELNDLEEELDDLNVLPFFGLSAAYHF